MSARIYYLEDYRLARAGNSKAAVSASTEMRASELQGQACAGPAIPRPADFASSFQFWTGASGKRYVHSVYSLRECPELPVANYVLVRRDMDGRCHALAVGRLTCSTPTINMAEIRQRGALLGATEVHVHLLAEGRRQMKDIERDLRGGQFPTSMWSAQN